MTIKIKETASHRNGISGTPFKVVRFDMTEDGMNHHMVGIVFDHDGECAVLDIDELAKGNIAFGNGNSWRGDDFESALHDAVKEA